MTDYALTLSDIHARALRGVSLALLPGEIAGVVAPAGAGKSTLLQVAAGCLKPHAGAATVGGTPVVHAAARRLIGYAPDGLAFPPALTVREILTYYARLRCSANGDRTPRGSTSTGHESAAAVCWVSYVVNLPP